MSAPAGTEAIAAELARLGAATVYEASGRCGLVDLDLIQLIPTSRACGPARTVRCGQGDNLMVHAAMARLQPGEVLVLTMPEPAPVALIGDLLMTQAQVRGAAAILNDAAVRDSEELVEMGLPVWTRWVRSRGATKQLVGELDVPVVVGGQAIRPGDFVVLDGDGATVVAGRPGRRGARGIACARGEGADQAGKAPGGRAVLRARRPEGDRRG